MLDNTNELSQDRLDKMKVSELKTELRKRNQRVTGNKQELLARLKDALETQAADALTTDDAGESGFFHT